MIDAEPTTPQIVFPQRRHEGELSVTIGNRTAHPAEFAGAFYGLQLAPPAPADSIIAPELLKHGAPVTLEQAKAAHVLRVLRELGGNLSETARVLAVDRRTLYRMAKRWGIR